MVNNNDGDKYMNEKEKKKCLDIINKHMESPNYLYNFIMSFIFGGLLSILGQGLIFFYQYLGIDEKVSQSLMSVTFILIASILTGIGIYDKFGQIAKAGAFVPITGFANSMTSAALEAKSEGIVTGIAQNLFKIAGSVITFGVVSAYILGILRYLWELII